MNLLSPAELEGVMAHELAHVKNRDVMIMTIASFFASVAAMILQFGFLFGGGGTPTTTTAPASSSIIIVSLVVYVVSFLLMMALSRYREFVADRGAALVTGRPSALASALRKISSGMDRLPQQDLRVANELSAFFIASPKKVDRRPVLDAPADGAAHRAAHGVRAPSCRPARSPRRSLRVVGFLDAILGGKKKLKGRRRPTACSRCRRRTSRSTPATDHDEGRRGDRLPAAGDRRLRGDRRRDGGAAAGTGADTGTTITTSDGRARLPLDRSCATTTSTTSSSASTPSATRSMVGGYGDRVLAAVFAFKDSKGRRRVLHLQLQARLLVSVRAAPGTQPRDGERELQVRAIIDGELPIEPELERWFPLWGIPI